jgi:hypothetical protein
VGDFWWTASARDMTPRPDLTSWHTSNDGSAWDIACADTSGSDYAAFSQAHAREYHCVRANPDVVLDHHCLPDEGFEHLVTAIVMGQGRDGHMRAHNGPVADRDSSPSPDMNIGSQRHIVADMYLATPCDYNGMLYLDIHAA